MKKSILVVIATKREYEWWSDIRATLSSIFAISILNCSSFDFPGTFKLSDYLRYSPENYIPFQGDLACPRLSDIFHESKHYPNRDLSFLYQKFYAHYYAYEAFFTGHAFDTILFENGAFIFINALISYLASVNQQFFVLEQGPYPGTGFIFQSSKGPFLDNCLDSPFHLSDTLGNNQRDPLTQDKDKGADLSTVLLKRSLLKSSIAYFKRRHKSPYFNIDGGFLPILSVKLFANIKYLLIMLHQLKALFLFRTTSTSSIIVPLHLFKDLAINERFGVLSQIEFLSILQRKYPHRRIQFKLHPHAVRTGLTISDHLRLLFSRFTITSLRPSDLVSDLHVVHTLGSKYGFEAASRNIKTYSYGNTFFSQLYPVSRISSVPLHLTSNYYNKLSSKLFPLNLYNFHEGKLYMASILNFLVAR